MSNYWPLFRSRPRPRSDRRLNQSKQSIWIDLDNSPHVPLFLPIIKHYKAVGVEVILTARDHAQTVELLNLAGLSGEFTVIGRHFGKSTLKKLAGLLQRAFQLSRFIRSLGKRPNVAVSHGSRSMVLAAWMLRIPVVTMYDYEFTETRIFNTLSNKILVPNAIPDSTLDEIGLSKKKREKYAGIKEELYIRGYEKDEAFWAKFVDANQLTIADEIIIAVLRPPAGTANYHSGQSDILFRAALDRLLGSDNVFTIITPRTAEQREQITQTIRDLRPQHPNFMLLGKAVDGLDLVSNADLLISGGGTMNREAVLLGIPVYSIFQGRRGSLDDAMERSGQICFLSDADDVRKIDLVKKNANEKNALTDRVELSFRKQIDCFLNNG